MDVDLRALRHRSAILLVWSLMLLSLGAGTASPAAADDTAAWFGHSFRGTNLGLSAGVMHLGARSHSEEFARRAGSGTRAEGARSRRSARGTRVASLGYTPSGVESEEPEERTATQRASRKTRVSSLGYAPPSVGTDSRQERVARKRTLRKTRLASLGGSIVPKPDFGPSLSGGSVRWAASSGCLNPGLRAVVASVAASFGPVTVNSTCRSRRHNARVGGARHSHHLTGNAVDFRVRSGWRGVWAFLRSGGVVGGIKHYGRGLFHIDTGPRRTW